MPSFEFQVVVLWWVTRENSFLSYCLPIIYILRKGRKTVGFDSVASRHHDVDLSVNTFWTWLKQSLLRQFISEFRYERGWCVMNFTFSQGRMVDLKLVFSFWKCYDFLVFHQPPNFMKNWWHQLQFNIPGSRIVTCYIAFIFKPKLEPIYVWLSIAWWTEYSDVKKQNILVSSQSL